MIKRFKKAWYNRKEVKVKDPVVEKSELVIGALHYAQEHNLDVSNKDDVQKILEALDPEHAQDIDEFVELLKNGDLFMEITARAKGSKKKDLPN